MAQGVVETVRRGIRIRVSRERSQHRRDQVRRFSCRIQPEMWPLNPVVAQVADRGIGPVGGRVGRAGEIVRVVPGAGVRRDSNIPCHLVARTVQAGCPL